MNARHAVTISSVNGTGIGCPPFAGSHHPQPLPQVHVRAHRALQLGGPLARGDEHREARAGLGVGQLAEHAVDDGDGHEDRRRFRLGELRHIIGGRGDTLAIEHAVQMPEGAHAMIDRLRRVAFG
jgi:hypothetical protein